jgi:hypothetical protein
MDGPSPQFKITEPKNFGIIAITRTCSELLTHNDMSVNTANVTYFTSLNVSDQNKIVNIFTQTNVLPANVGRKM